MFGKRRAPLDVPQSVVSSQALQLPPPPAPTALTAGWRGMPGTQNPSQQIGVYDGQMLTQYPANLPGPQLLNGRVGNNPGWNFPLLAPAPLGNNQLTTQGTADPGSQRYGSMYGGPIGPISARKYAARVTAAQVRQSGLQAMQWARGLSQ